VLAPFVEHLQTDVPDGLPLLDQCWRRIRHLRDRPVVPVIPDPRRAADDVDAAGSDVITVSDEENA
jgi:hypothetical protein